MTVPDACFGGGAVETDIGTALVHLTLGEYHVIGGEDFGPQACGRARRPALSWTSRRWARASLRRGDAGAATCAGIPAEWLGIDLRRRGASFLAFYDLRPPGHIASNTDSTTTRSISVLTSATR